MQKQFWGNYPYFKQFVSIWLTGDYLGKCNRKRKNWSLLTLSEPHNYTGQLYQRWLCGHNVIFEYTTEYTFLYLFCNNRFIHFVGHSCSMRWLMAHHEETLSHWWQLYGLKVCTENQLQHVNSLLLCIHLKLNCRIILNIKSINMLNSQHAPCFFKQILKFKNIQT